MARYETIDWRQGDTEGEEIQVIVFLCSSKKKNKNKKKKTIYLNNINKRMML